jgi:hypothetical protein
VKDSLSVSQVTTLIDSVIDAFPLEECATCECFLGYVTQLERDSEKSIRLFLKSHKPNRAEIHSCLGCDPCPPADMLAGYLRESLR